MALNLEKLDKGNREFQYYYSDKGNSFGPFVLSVLLTKIGPDSLVYREGLEWTKAAQIPELKMFFEKKYSTSGSTTSETQIIVSEKKNRISNSWIFASVAFIGIVFFGYTLYINVTQGLQNSNSKETETTLNDFEIFNFESVRSYKPSTTQINAALVCLNQARDYSARNDYFNAITKYKECLRNNPMANAYMELMEMYWKVSDFDKCELCALMASNLDFQPRTDISKKLMQIHAVQNKFRLLISEIRTQSTTDYSILNFIDTDLIFRDFRKSEDYLSLIENNSICDSTSDYFNKIISYYNDLNYGNMNAFAYFSPRVEQYITMRNDLTPLDINVLWENNNEYLNGNYKVIGNRCYFSATNKREVWIEFKCYRASKQKMQDCRVKVEFVFDNAGKVLSYKELQVKDVKFY